MGKSKENFASKQKKKEKKKRSQVKNPNAGKLSAPRRTWITTNIHAMDIDPNPAILRMLVVENFFIFFTYSDVFERYISPSFIKKKK